MTIRTLSTILFVALIAAFAISKTPTMPTGRILHGRILELLFDRPQVTSNGDAHATAEVK